MNVFTEGGNGEFISVCTILDCIGGFVLIHPGLNLVERCIENAQG